MEGYLSSDVEDSPEIKLNKFETNRTEVIKWARQKMKDIQENPAHDSHSEEEEVEELDTHIIEVLYETGE